MRLINVTTFEIEEFFDDEIPKYWTLSHTWRRRQEPTFQEWTKVHSDLAGRTPEEIESYLSGRPNRTGFDKVISIIGLAQLANVQYCWADTVCIDKSSSAELSEAINSMYRIYQSCERCVVYLSDVKMDTEPYSFGPPSSFAHSKWFTRGWTLQELIAPAVVVFYDCHWKYMGNKSEDALQKLIKEVTGIPQSLLDVAGSKDHFCVAQKLSWASNRRTTRKEDEAYCLLGLLGIYMPLLYGEGANAFLRLQEELIRRSDDDSIFAWWPQNASLYTHRGILAQSPQDFAQSSNVYNATWDDSHVDTYSITNRGVRLHLYGNTPRSKPKEFVASLDCMIVNPNSNHVRERVTISLRNLDQQYIRIRCHEKTTADVELNARAKKAARVLFAVSTESLHHTFIAGSCNTGRVRGFCHQFGRWANSCTTLISVWPTNCIDASQTNLVNAEGQLKLRFGPEVFEAGSQRRARNDLDRLAPVTFKIHYKDSSGKHVFHHIQMNPYEEGRTHTVGDHPHHQSSLNPNSMIVETWTVSASLVDKVLVIGPHGFELPSDVSPNPYGIEKGVHLHGCDIEWTHDEFWFYGAWQ
jgi:hypothetical protein